MMTTSTSATPPPRPVMAAVLEVAGSVLPLAVAIFLDRSQMTVRDGRFMNSMIPYPSMAITRSECAQLDDVPVCELAVESSEAQWREILEMAWLVDDIEGNGAAETPRRPSAPRPGLPEACRPSVLW